MKARCHYFKHESWEDYGGRGIFVCLRWLEDFANFYEDMGERKPGMTLDRIDVNGHYCKENCRWADWFTQAHNKRADWDSNFNVGILDEDTGLSY